MKKKMEELYQELEKYNYQYHTLNQSEISDYDYDRKIIELQKLEIKYPEFKKENSITEQIGNEVIDKFKKVEHEIPMLSLDNAFSFEDLQKFDNRVQKELNGKKYTYIVELKIDGIAMSLTYQDKLILAATRGNGRIGENVTHNIKTIKTLPKHVNNTITVRGEVYITKKNFQKIKQEEKIEYANPRNLTSGTVRQLDNSVARRRNLDMFVYGLVEWEKFGHKTYYESMQFLKAEGFTINESLQIFSNIEDIYKYILEITAKRNSLKYEIDGIVIKVNEYQNQNILGYTAKYPKWAIAYKFASTRAKTTLIDIIYTVGRTGRVTPNAVLKPIFLMGSTISKATLHNQDYIKEKDIRIGDEVEIIKAGDIIPRVDEVLLSDDHYDLPKTKFIENCPECHTLLEKIDKDYICPNPNCPAKNIEKLIYFVSQNAMNITGLGNKIIEKLYTNDIIKDYVDIYDLTYDELYSLEGFKDKSIKNILDSIENSKNVEFANFLAALGIKNLGLETAKLITKKYKTLQNLYELKLEDLLNIDGIGLITAQSILDFFDEENNIEKLNYLLSKGLIIKNNYYLLDKENLKYQDKVFVITGSFENYKRNDLKTIIEKLGGKVSSAISTKTNFLLCGDNAGSKLEKAQKLNIPIITENEINKFLEI